MWIILIILLILCLGGLPNFGYSNGYGPSGLIGLVLIVLLVFFLMGRLRF